MGGWGVKVNATTRNEYHNSGYTGTVKAADPQIYADKMRAARNVDEIVQTAEGTANEDPKHPRKDNFKSFHRGTTRIQIGNNKYSADVVTGITPNGKETLYDIVDLAPITTTKPSRQILMPQNATSSPDIGTVSDPTLPQSAEGVNISIFENGAGDFAHPIDSIKKERSPQVPALPPLGGAHSGNV